MINLSATAGLQSAEHLYNLREIMETFHLYWASFVASQLRSYTEECDAANRAGLQFDEAKVSEVESIIRDARHLCDKIGWTSTANTIGGIIEMDVWPQTAGSYEALSIHLSHCSRALDQAFLDHLFLYVPTDDAELYTNPLEQFSKVVVGFPSSSSNTIEACRCYALGRYTACVFHCMGILQYGLYALANELKVSLNVPLPMSEWCKIINNIESKINELRNFPKSEAKDERLKFYSECSVQFRYFKDGWRNHVAHLREEYDKDQAHSALIHTREFMEHLTTRSRSSHFPN